MARATPSPARPRRSRATGADPWHTALTTKGVHWPITPPAAPGDACPRGPGSGGLARVGVHRDARGRRSEPGDPGAGPAPAKALGYRPDARTRALVGQGSKLIGVIFGVTGSFHLDILDGRYAAAEDAGFGLILSALTRGRDEERVVQSLQDFRSTLS
jgi:hypothetical protein